MKRVTGIGGVFFKSKNPEELKTWYAQHLGLPLKEDGDVSFHWREAEHPDQPGRTVWAPFPSDTEYFKPSQASFMINYRVENLDALLSELRKEGVKVDDRIEEYDYGRFAWIMDPEGNRIELWEPPAKKD
jgi:predicted enzyme related to lactoylglutathione lyase